MYLFTYVLFFWHHSFHVVLLDQYAHMYDYTLPTNMSLSFKSKVP